jgi:hyperosmotically inducible protein
MRIASSQPVARQCFVDLVDSGLRLAFLRRVQVNEPHHDHTREIHLMIRITRSIAVAGLVGSLGLVACGDSDASSIDREPSADSARLSTAATSEDRSARENETTAINQSNSSEHIEITATIRRAVMDDDALSTIAKNSTIVTDDTGTVTLRGDVRSQAEKNAIALKAARVVGAERVVNRLVVNP